MNKTRHLKNERSRNNEETKKVKHSRKAYTCYGNYRLNHKAVRLNRKAYGISRGGRNPPHKNILYCFLIVNIKIMKGFENMDNTQSKNLIELIKLIKKLPKEKVRELYYMSCGMKCAAAQIEEVER